MFCTKLMGLRPTLGITHEIRYCKISSHFLKRKVGTPKHEMQLPDSSAAMEHTHTSASLEMGGFNEYPSGTISLNKLNTRL